MAAATCQAQVATGASATWGSAEGGIKMSREDSIVGTTPVPIPTTTGTNFSWLKQLALAVTATGSTNITNRRISMSATTSTGLALYWITVASASYAQAAAGNLPAASGSNGATPVRNTYPGAGSFTAVTTSAVQYDNTTVTTSSTGVSGLLLPICLGVD